MPSMGHTFEDLVAEADSVAVDGWDFSWLDGRATEERPSWGYQRTLSQRLDAVSAALDMHTGGGEVLSGAGPFPPASLARQDACALLTPAELSAAQVDTGHPDVGFGRWNCRWHARTGGTGVQLRFDRNGPLGADAGTPARLGGHAAYVQPDGDGSGTCLAQVVHRTYRSTGGGTTAEIVFLVVSGSQRSARLCALAKSLASAAATRLPTV